MEGLAIYIIMSRNFVGINNKNHSTIDVTRKAKPKRQEEIALWNRETLGISDIRETLG
jgi:hypothetical protein